MKIKRPVVFWVLGFVLLLSIACGSIASPQTSTPSFFAPGETSPPLSSPAGLATNTAFPPGQISSPSPQAVSETPAPPTLAPAASIPASDTPSLPTDTETPAAPTLKAVQDLFIRDGPGTYYLALGVLRRDDRALVLGNAAPYGPIWWKIDCPPDVAGDSCWVTSGAEFSQVVNGDLVPAAEVPPTPLNRQEVPPAGVAAQLSFFIPFGKCAFHLSPGKTTQFGDLEVLQDLRICLDGFSRPGPIQLQIIKPDGKRLSAEKVNFPPSGDPGYTLNILPQQPLGQYTLLAEEGSLKATAAFTLVTATQPRLTVLPGSAPPGSTFQIELAGFQTDPTLYLYRSEGQAFQYLTTLGSVHLDHRKESIQPLKAAPDDPAGFYMLADASGKIKAVFSVK
jgi:hypothetical protein